MPLPLLPWLAIPPGSPEISDVIVSFEQGTLARLPVRRDDAIAALRAAGNAPASRIVEALPHRGGVLDDAFVDRVLVGAHRELQRLSEEFDHARRVTELLAPVVSACRGSAVRSRLRVVDVGCGLGYVLRAIAQGHSLPGVDLVGVDFNPTLVAEASRLGALERLGVSFVRADALSLEPPADVYVSTGVLHHLRGPSLAAFLRAQMNRGRALVHFDFQPSPATPFGAWMFHRARFRLPLARHDGTLSAIRAHPGRALVEAAKAGPRGFRVALYGQRWIGPFPRVFHALVAAREDLWEAFVAALGGRAGRLGPVDRTTGEAA